MPYIEWFDAPTEKNGACMLLISGGGYQNCCDWRWIDRVAKKFTDLGYVCVSLTYRTPRPHGLPIYQSGWQDGQRAVRLVRQSAKQRGFEPEKIGVLGFSAGGHLTVLLGTSALTPAYEAVDATDEVPCHVNLAVPIYVAYALTDGLTGPNTRGGNTIDAKLSDVFKFDCKDLPYGPFSRRHRSLFPHWFHQDLSTTPKNENTSRGPPLCRSRTRLYGGSKQGREWYSIRSLARSGLRIHATDEF